MLNTGYLFTNFDGEEDIYDIDIKDTSQFPVKYSYMNILSKVEDQGTNPHCVPHSILAALEPFYNLEDLKDMDITPSSIFKSRTNEYGEGMYFKDALNHLKKLNIFNHYSLVKSIFMLKFALVTNGPCVGGLYVYDLRNTDFWTDYLGSVPIGGHAVTIVGFDEDGFIIRNSWGQGYGFKGYSHLKYEHFNSFYEIWTIIPD